MPCHEAVSTNHVKPHRRGLERGKEMRSVFQKNARKHNIPERNVDTFMQE